MIDSAQSPPFVISMPARQTAPCVFSSPHSGRVYPPDFVAAARLDAHALRKSEDCYVDELFACAPEFGAPLISARFARAYLDVNREPYELDPELFSGPLPKFANTQSVRVAGGLGTIPRIVADAEEIYREPLPVGVALERINRVYKPYHSALAAMIEATRRRFGVVVVIDCHSMPSASMHTSASRPDIVIGDRFGASCDGRVTQFAREAIGALGYRTQLNRPYAGGYITEHYGQPARGTQALQLEINRALYMNETTLEPSAGFDRLREDLAALLARLCRELPNVLCRRMAAE